MNFDLSHVKLGKLAFSYIYPSGFNNEYYLESVYMIHYHIMCHSVAHRLFFNMGRNGWEIADTALYLCFTWWFWSKLKRRNYTKLCTSVPQTEESQYQYIEHQYLLIITTITTSIYIYTQFLQNISWNQITWNWLIRVICKFRIHKYISYRKAIIKWYLFVMFVQYFTKYGCRHYHTRLLV